MADPRDELTYADMANEPGWVPPREPLRIRVSPYDMPPPSETGWGGFGSGGRPTGRLFEPDLAPAPEQPFPDPTAGPRQMWQQGYPSTDRPSLVQRGVTEALNIPQRFVESGQGYFDPETYPGEQQQRARRQVEAAADVTSNLAGAGMTGASIRGGASVGAAGGVLRGKAAEEAWRGTEKEPKLRTTVHPYSNVGGTPIREMESPIIRGAPKGEPRKIDVEKDLSNAEFIFTGGDRTGAGGKLYGSKEMPFEQPVSRFGGPGYGQIMQGKKIEGAPGASPVWASQKSAMGEIYNIASDVERRGKVPWQVYMTGGGQYLDSSMQMVDTALQAAKAKGVSTMANEHLVKVMQSDWNTAANSKLPFPETGLKDEKALRAWIDASPQPQRAKLVKAMDTKQARELGFPDMGQLRVWNTDARMLTAPPGSAGLAMARIDPKVGLIPSHHPAYDTAIAGRDVGTLGMQVPHQIIAPTMHESRMATLVKPQYYEAAPHLYFPGGGTKALKTEPVTNKLKDILQRWMLDNPGGLAVAGTAGGFGSLVDPRQAAAQPSAVAAVPEPKPQFQPGLLSLGNVARGIGSLVSGARDSFSAPQQPAAPPRAPVDPTAGSRAMWQQGYPSGSPSEPGIIGHAAGELLQAPHRMIEAGRIIKDPDSTEKEVRQARKQEAEAAFEITSAIAGTSAPFAAGRAGTAGAFGGDLLRGKPGGPWEGGIRAYHSSPHDFDKFDWSKLRTGEGANVYGAGFYAAENPAVSGQGGQYWSQFLHKFPKEELRSAEWLRQHGFDREAATVELQRQIGDLQSKVKGVGSASAEDMGLKFPTAEDQRVYRDNLKHYYNDEIGKYQKRLEHLQGGGPVGPRTYEVNINARPELLLDWDKPLSAQPQMVKQLNAAGLDLPPNLGDLTYLRQKVAENGPDSWYADQLRSVQGIGEKTGADIYANLSGGMHNRYGQTDRAVQANYASQHLADAGIPGIRYLDQGSRGAVREVDELLKIYGTPDRIREIAQKLQREAAPDAEWWARAVRQLDQPQGTYNYVVTDPSKLDILAKYGIVGTAGAGGIGSLVDPRQYQPGGS